MEKRKYELLEDDFIVLNDGTKLYRIRALKDFRNVKAGDLGGYIEKDLNLSHKGNCWVCDSARVYGNAKIFDDATVYGNAEVFGYARVYGNAEVYGSARVYGNAKIFYDTTVYGNAEVFGYTRVYGNAEVFGCAKVYDNAIVCGNSKVFGRARVYENARVYGNAEVFDNAIVGCSARVYNNAKVYDNAIVGCSADVCGYAEISSIFDYTTIRGFGSKARNTTFYKTKNNNIEVVCGCFKGTLEEFRSKVLETHKKSKFAKEYLMIADLMEYHFKERINKND